MIQRISADEYVAVCDNCGDDAETGGRSVEQARREAEDEGFYVEVGGMNLCPECRVDPDVTGIEA